MVTDFRFSPDAKFVLTCPADGTLRLRGVSSGELLKTFEGHSSLVVIKRPHVEAVGLGIGSREPFKRRQWGTRA